MLWGGPSPMEVLVLLSVPCPAGWAGSPVAVGLVQGQAGHGGDWHEGFEGQQGVLALSTKLQPCRGQW